MALNNIEMQPIQFKPLDESCGCAEEVCTIVSSEQGLNFQVQTTGTGANLLPFDETNPWTSTTGVFEPSGATLVKTLGLDGELRANGVMTVLEHYELKIRCTAINSIGQVKVFFGTNQVGTITQEDNYSFYGQCLGTGDLIFTADNNTAATLDRELTLLMVDTMFDLYTVDEEGTPITLITATPIIAGNTLLYQDIFAEVPECFRIGLFPDDSRAEWVNIFEGLDTPLEEFELSLASNCPTQLRLTTTGFTTGQGGEYEIIYQGNTIVSGFFENGTTIINIPSGLISSPIFITITWPGDFTPEIDVDFRENCLQLISNCLRLKDASCDLVPVEAGNDTCAFGFQFTNNFKFKMLVPGKVQNYKPETRIINISDQRGQLRTAFADVRRHYIFAFDPLSNDALEALSVMRLMDDFTIDGKTYTSTEDEMTLDYDDQDTATGSFEIALVEPRRNKPC